MEQRCDGCCSGLGGPGHHPRTHFTEGRMGAPRGGVLARVFWRTGRQCGLSSSLLWSQACPGITPVAAMWTFMLMGWLDVAFSPEKVFFAA